MLTTYDIIDTLENYHHHGFANFFRLSDEEMFYIDARLNIFRHPDGRWAIVLEKLVFDPWEWRLLLVISCLGNCVQRGENGTNYHEVVLLDEDELKRTFDGWWLRRDAQYWQVRKEQVRLCHQRQLYNMAGITPDLPGHISVVEAARYLAFTDDVVFRATDAELYKHLPADLEKLLVLDDWYHEDFFQDFVLNWNDEQLLEIMQAMGDEWKVQCYSKEALRSMLNAEANRQERKLFGPASYETWPMLAEVIVTGDVWRYAPTDLPNTHWMYWPNEYEDI